MHPTHFRDEREDNVVIIHASIETYCAYFCAKTCRNLIHIDGTIKKAKRKASKNHAVKNKDLRNDCPRHRAHIGDGGYILRVDKVVYIHRDFVEIIDGVEI